MNKKSRITCPQCRKEAIVPAGGVKELDKAFIINHMVDQLVLHCPVEDETEVECDECLRDRPVLLFCPDCSLFLCQDCVDYHTYSKQFQDHRLVTLMKSQSNKSLAMSCSTAAPDPQQCQTIDIPKHAIIGKMVKFTIITRDNSGDRCFREGADQVSVQLDGVSNTILVSENNDGVYVACFAPYQVGKVKMSVCVNKKHVKGSPYNVVATRNFTSLSKPSKTVDNSGGMAEPWGIGFSRDGKWAVADINNHCVYLYDDNDQFLRKIGSRGHSGGQFNFPTGVAFDDEDHLYVTDGYHRIQKFTIDGEYLLQFGRCEADISEEVFPDCLIVHNGKVYVADCKNSCISVFLTDGTFHQTIGKGQLVDPYDIAVTSNEELLVVDHFIYRFTLDGNYIDKFINYDDGWYDPDSIAIDSNNFILVTDSGNNQVVIFDSFGNLVHKFGSEGSGDGEFLYPSGIAVNKNGDIYVTDFENKRIQIFSNY